MFYTSVPLLRLSDLAVILRLTDLGNSIVQSSLVLCNYMEVSFKNTLQDTVMKLYNRNRYGILHILECKLGHCDIIHTLVTKVKFLFIPQLDEYHHG